MVARVSCLIFERDAYPRWYRRHCVCEHSHQKETRRSVVLETDETTGKGDEGSKNREYSSQCDGS